MKEELAEGDYTVPIGKAAVVRAGTDLSIITYGGMVHAAQEAAGTLEKEGISVEIVDVRTRVPRDEATILESGRKTSKVIVLHEATLTGGFGGEIAARITERAFEYLDGPVLRMAAPDTPVPFSPPLEEAFLPSVAGIAGKSPWLFRSLTGFLGTRRPQFPGPRATRRRLSGPWVGGKVCCVCLLSRC